MKKYLILILGLFIGIYYASLFVIMQKRDVINLGSSSGPIWIYLCGLTKDYNSSEEIEKRELFKQIGMQNNFRFIAIKPPARCVEFDNKLYWPSNTKKQVFETYRYICDKVGNKNIAGFIGFSNGGFFLNQLVQYIKLEIPIISIGSAGCFHAALPNNLYLLISKEDIYHYTHALNFYRAAQNSLLQIKLIEYSGGHIIPFSLLEELLVLYFKNLDAYSF